MNEFIVPAVPEQEPKAKPVVTAVVPSEGITDTGSVDYMFMITADVPLNLLSGRAFGVLQRVAKAADHVEPFKLARGEAGGYGDDGIARWRINVGEYGRQILGGSVDADDAGEGLAQLLQQIPDCVVLIPPADIEAVKQSGAVDLHIVDYNGVLPTST